jgi:acetylornithine deacetylase
VGAGDFRSAVGGCVVGEPTSMQPIIAHKGMHRFRCSVHGREAHSSYVTHGVNAIEYAARLVVFIRQIADRLAQIETRDCGFTVPYSTLSTGLIRGGIAANVVPKDCVFQFDMRTLPNASPDALYQEIHAFARDLTREMQAVDEKSGIDLEWLSQTAGLAASETDAIVQWAMRLSGNERGHHRGCAGQPAARAGARASTDWLGSGPSRRSVPGPRGGCTSSGT